jgi:uncharacterized protein
MKPHPITGEKDLATLLRTMKPVLQPGEYVFCLANELNVSHLPVCVAWFREAEGHTLVLPRPEADRLGLAYSFVAAWLTLTVHSDLAAVGLTAAVSQALAQAGLSCNVMAAYFHDHIFVEAAHAQLALQVLEDLARDAATG